MGENFVRYRIFPVKPPRNSLANRVRLPGRGLKRRETGRKFRPDSGIRSELRRDRCQWKRCGGRYRGISAGGSGVGFGAGGSVPEARRGDEVICDRVDTPDDSVRRKVGYRHPNSALVRRRRRRAFPGRIRRSGRGLSSFGSAAKGRCGGVLGV